MSTRLLAPGAHTSQAAGRSVLAKLTEPPEHAVVPVSAFTPGAVASRTSFHVVPFRQNTTKWWTVPDPRPELTTDFAPLPVCEAPTAEPSVCELGKTPSERRRTRHSLTGPAGI